VLSNGPNKHKPEETSLLYKKHSEQLPKTLFKIAKITFN